MLTFQPEATGEPITYNLIRKFDIMVNIVKADVSPGQVGHLVMEMSAPSKVLKDGIEYMKQQKVECVPIDRTVTYRKELCVHCGACSAVCFAGALTMDRKSAELVFEPEKCVVCELCLTACPLKLFEIDLG